VTYRVSTAIIGMSSPPPHKTLIAPWNACITTRDYGTERSPRLDFQLVEDMQSVLQGKPSELMQTALWNGGFTCVVEFAQICARV